MGKITEGEMRWGGVKRCEEGWGVGEEGWGGDKRCEERWASKEVRGVVMQTKGACRVSGEGVQGYRPTTHLPPPWTPNSSIFSQTNQLQRA
jgi:hypothetical protein